MIRLHPNELPNPYADLQRRINEDSRASQRQIAGMRADLASLRVYLADADAYDPDTLREMRAREARLLALIGDSHE